MHLIVRQMMRQVQCNSPVTKTRGNLGKQSKRKQKGGRNNNKQCGSSSGANGAAGKKVDASWRPRVDLSKASSHDRAVILKIRHGDARIRNGALSGEDEGDEMGWAYGDDGRTGTRGWY
jgi:hypothetical protein